LAHLRAAYEAGKYHESLDEAARVADAAKRTGYAPLIAEALFRYGSVQSSAGDALGAEAALYDAAFAADAAADDRKRVEAWGGLLQLAGKEKKFDAVSLLRRQAEAALARLGGDEEAECRYLLHITGMLRLEGRLSESHDAGERALVLSQRLFGNQGYQYARALGSIAVTDLEMGNYEKALATSEQLARLSESALGPLHPFVGMARTTAGAALVADLRFAEAEIQFRRALAIEEAVGGDTNLPIVLDDLGEVLSEEGQYEAAIQYHRRALSVREATLRPGHPWLGISLLGLGRSYLGMGEPAEARPYLERALGLVGINDGDDTVRADVEFALARAISGTHGSARRARELSVDARALCEKSGKGPQDARNLGRINAWLSEHPAKP
jgi:serine/threonine-protein kinase